jgi:uncharacterized membrane protein YeaQ/YmgE (transglycosylase-associated protein family)
MFLWLLIGIAAGIMTSYYWEERTGKNLVLNMLLGLIGAFVGGELMSLYSVNPPLLFGVIDIFSLIVTIVMAGLVIWLGHFKKTIL